jgi:hypothetical protein
MHRRQRKVREQRWVLCMRRRAQEEGDAQAREEAIQQQSRASWAAGCARSDGDGDAIVSASTCWSIRWSETATGVVEGINVEDERAKRTMPTPSGCHWPSTSSCGDRVESGTTLELRKACSVSGGDRRAAMAQRTLHMKWSGWAVNGSEEDDDKCGVDDANEGVTDEGKSSGRLKLGKR